MTAQLLPNLNAGHRTMADWWEHLGEIPLERILFDPVPGSATEDHQKALLDSRGILCELVDGTLVVKPMGLYESVVALLIVQMMGPYMSRHKPGILSGADGPFRLVQGLVRLPDVCFVSYAQIPDRANWSKYIQQLHPDLAIEIISPGNTPKEMERKRREYFDAGTTLVWYIYPATRTAVVWTSFTDSTSYADKDVLDASPVMPGFTLPLDELFDQAGPPPADFK